MRITSKIDAVDSFICHEELSELYESSWPLKEKEVVLQDPAIASLCSTQYISCGFCILDTRMVFNQPVCDYFEISGESVMMGFYLEGDATAEVTGLLPKRTHPANIQYVCYTPFFKAEFQMPPHKLHRYFLIILSKEAYFRLLHQHSELHQEFASSVLEGRHIYLSKTPLPITAEMKWVINDMRNCQRTGSLKQLYLEAKITELLMLQLEQWQKHQVQPNRSSILRGDDEQRIAEAKAILEENFANPPTIQELARLVYLNEYKLKQGFKACCNITVHNYVVRLRMEKARELLTQSQQSIGDIAYEVGYKNSAHFTASFKKHFGFLPSDIKV
jgi:AraC-like DNA-binding protein